MNEQSKTVLVIRCQPLFRIKWFLLLLFIFTLSNILSAQPASLKFSSVNPSFIEEANPEYLFFSSSGKMWFASLRGLASFDGSQMSFYNTPDEAASLGNTLIYKIAEDRQGNFWIGTQDRGVNFFESRTGRFTKITLLLKGENTEQRLVVNDIFIESDSSILIATSSFGFFIYNPLTRSSRHFNLDVTKTGTWKHRYKNTPQHFVRDPENKTKIWIGAYDGIYSCNSSGKNLIKEFKVPVAIKEDEKIPQSFCRILRIDVPGNDTIWFSTWSNGMGYCDISTGNTELFPHNKNEKDLAFKNLIIPNFFRKSDYEYYVTSRRDLPAIFNTHTRQYQFIRDEELEKSNAILSNMAPGNNNSIWICKGGNLYFHSPQHWLYRDIDISYQDIPDVRANLMRDIFWDEEKKIFYASVDFSSGVFVLDSLLRMTKIIPMPLNPPGSVNTEASLFETVKDGSGRIWARGDILAVCTEKAERFEAAYKLFPRLSFLKKRFNDFTLDEKGNILLLSGSKIYIINHNNLSVDSVILQKKTRAATIVTEPLIHFDKKRKLLYAAGNNAIYQYNLEKRSFKYLVYNKQMKNSLPQDLISSYAIDGQGNIWVSSAHYGIRIYEPIRLEVIKEFTQENSEFSANVELKYCGDELMLMQTNSGIFIYNITKASYHKLNIKNGMRHNHPWGVAVANNNLFLGMRDTIQYMPLSKLSLLSRTIRPYISRINIVGFQVISDTLPEHVQVLKLNHRQRTISFEFSAIEFEFPERVRYAHQLEGVDENWTYTDNNSRTVTYSNLSSGKYTFRVHAQFQKGEKMEGEEKRIHIIITPPFWETWWFRLLAVIAAAVLLGAIINYRIRQVRKKAWAQNQFRELELKALKAQMNPHFIYNAMNSIQALVLGHKNSEASLYIGKFGRLLRQVLNNSDQPVISLEKEMEALGLYIDLEKLRMNMDLNYTIDISDEINTAKLMLPPLIFQPFVENALWHGLSNKNGDKKFSVTISRENGWLKTVIEDNGVGRAAAAEIKKQNHQMNSSMGIEMTTKRLADFNKSDSTNPVEITDLYDENNKPSGTKVTIMLLASAPS